MLDFSRELHIEPGLTALIGGGGKTSLMYRLAQELSARGRVICCTSTRIFPPEHLPLSNGTDENEVSVLLQRHRVTCLGHPAERGKLSAPGLPFERLTKLADFVLVEADGSARLPAKAHLDHEPVIPADTPDVICVLGASAFGRPICEVVHRYGQAGKLLQVEEDAIFTPELAGKLLQAEGLGTKVFVNQVDSEQELPLAEELATHLALPLWAGSVQKGWIRCLR